MAVEIGARGGGDVICGCSLFFPSIIGLVERGVEVTLPPPHPPPTRTCLLSLLLLDVANLIRVYNAFSYTFTIAVSTLTDVEI